MVFAMVFCLLGVGFACNTSRNKDAIYGSASSLDKRCEPSLHCVCVCVCVCVYVCEQYTVGHVLNS